jgi:hypothetical protein
MPASLFDNLSNRFLFNEVSRDELRTLWHSYRSALEGKVPRRRVGPVERKVNTSRLKEAVALDVVQKKTEILLGFQSRPYREKFILPTQWEEPFNSKNRNLSAVLIGQRNKESLPDIHGLYVLDEEVCKDWELAEKDQTCDYIWIVVFNPAIVKKIRPGIGLIEITDADTLKSDKRGVLDLSLLITSSPTRVPDNPRKEAFIRKLLAAFL